MNRREFLQQTSLSCAALAAATISLKAAETGSTKPKIPIGFLGVTHSHGSEKVKLAMSSPDWDFVGVCETSEAGKATCAKLGVKLISQDELFQRAQVVAVESDARDHASHALLALQAGKHLHLEKPPTVRLVDFQAIVALAREKKLLLQTG